MASVIFHIRVWIAMRLYALAHKVTPYEPPVWGG